MCLIEGEGGRRIRAGRAVDGDIAALLADKIKLLDRCSGNGQRNPYAVALVSFICRFFSHIGRGISRKRGIELLINAPVGKVDCERGGVMTAEDSAHIGCHKERAGVSDAEGVLPGGVESDERASAVPGRGTWLR